MTGRRDPGRSGTHRGGAVGGDPEPWGDPGLPLVFVTHPPPARDLALRALVPVSGGRCLSRLPGQRRRPPPIPAGVRLCAGAERAPTTDRPPAGSQPPVGGPPPGS